MNISRIERQPRSLPFLALLSSLAAAASLAVLVVLLLYIRGNDSNHTAFEPWLLSTFFVPTIGVSILAFVCGSSRWSALVAFCLGFGGMAFLFYLDHFNVMVQYERWIERGMP